MLTHSDKDPAGRRKTSRRKLVWGLLLVPPVFAAIAMWIIFFGAYRFLPGGSHALIGDRADVRFPSCTADMNWFSLAESAPQGELAAVDGCSVTAKGPWFLDSNHVFPVGRGNINVLLATWVRSFAPERKGYDDSVGPLDLRGRKLVVRYRTSGAVTKSPIHFWLQVKSGPFGRYSNFYYREPLDGRLDAAGWRTAEIDFGRTDEFRCLGTIARKYYMYGCDISIGDALANINTDFGFIRFVEDGEVTIGGTFTLGAFDAR